MASNLPPSGMISDIGFIIGNSIGECISVEADAEDRFLGPFMRIIVKYDVNSPLRRPTKITLDHHLPPVRVLLRYEKLPEYCYICGLLGHQLKSCNISDYDLQMNDLNYPYGPWLRAEDAN